MVAGTASLLLLFSVFMSASGEWKTIRAVSGQDVTLTCRAPNNNIIVVQWSRADLRDEYVLLYRDGHFDPDYQHPSFMNRVDLQDRQMKDGDVSLILKDVTINDAGTYECRLLVSVYETDLWKNSYVYLHVDPPVPENITAESGQNVTLTCRAPNINIFAVEWSRGSLGDEYVFVYRKSHFDPEHQHPSFKNRVDLQDRQMKDGDVSLILNNVTINDDGTYKCRVYVEETKPRRLINIIHLTVDPPEQKNITAESGQDVTLTCRAPNNNIIVLEWSRADLGDKYVLLYRDDVFAPDNQHPSFKNRVDLQDRQMKDGDVSLILKDVTINDTGRYECRVFMKETKSWRSISIIYLHVVLPEQKNITAESGQDVTLTCRAPNENYITVEWSRADLGDKHVLLYRDGKFVPDEQHLSFKNRVDLQDIKMKDGDVSLILKDVTINDAGTYNCHVQREGGRLKLINSANLVVDPPGPSVGLIVGLSVSAVVLFAAAAAAVGFLVYGKHKRQQSQDSYQPPAELQEIEMSQTFLETISKSPAVPNSVLTPNIKTDDEGLIETDDHLHLQTSKLNCESDDPRIDKNELP
ncbi:unnamed protein product [Oreochromis niloticus]|nr:unnamed protein product [Mustela putorius furo]